MADQKQAPSPAFVMVALLLLGVTPLAHGQLVIVKGNLCCTSSGNCPPGAPGLPGVPLNVTCYSPLSGGSIIIGQGVTGVNGFYNVSIPNILQTLPNIPTLLNSCIVVITLPPNNTICPLLQFTNGALIGLLNNLLSSLFASMVTVTAYVNVPV